MLPFYLQEVRVHVLVFDKPKGMYNIGVTRELYIFECLINNVMEIVKKAGAWIPFYIMTSDKNYD